MKDKYKEIYDIIIHKNGIPHDCNNIISTYIDNEFICEICNSWLFYDSILYGGGWQCPVCTTFLPNSWFMGKIF